MRSHSENTELIEQVNRDFQERARIFPYSAVGEMRRGGVLETQPMSRGSGATMTAVELARYNVVAASDIAQSTFALCSAHLTAYATITQGSARELNERTYSWCPQCGETEGPRYPSGQPMTVGQPVTLLRGHHKGQHGTIRGFTQKKVQIDARIPTGAVDQWGLRETKPVQVSVAPEAVVLGHTAGRPIAAEDLIRAAEERGVVGSASVRKLHKLLLDLRFPEMD
ncbi:hypothetical protein ACWEOI_26550 [Nocardia sp. NPDC004340]